MKSPCRGQTMIFALRPPARQSPSREKRGRSRFSENVVCPRFRGVSTCGRASIRRAR
jgi:hypothetical protein